MSWPGPIRFLSSYVLPSSEQIDKKALLPALIAGLTVIVILLVRAVAQPLLPVIEVKSYVVVAFGFTLIGFPLASFPKASRERLVGTEPNVPTILKLGVPVKLKSKIVLCP